jgi:hypothetical protein
LTGGKRRGFRSRSTALIDNHMIRAQDCGPLFQGSIEERTGIFRE